mgnify:FL=1|nr:MFS transporter [uncultured Flavonifractor sp.]
MSTKKATAPASSRGFGAQGTGILVLTFLSILLMSNICYDSLNVTIPQFAGKFAAMLGLPQEQMGAAVGGNIALLYMFSTVAAWISVIGAGIWGALCGKKTCRFAWSLSLVVAAVGCLIWSQAGSSPIYFVALALSYIGGMGFAYIASLNVVSNWFPHKKGLAMGWVTIGFPLSAVVATPLCTALVNFLELSGIYYLYAALCIILAIVVWVYVRDYPEEKGAFPDNNHNFDKAAADAELKAGLEYMKTSPWKPGKLLRTGTVWKMIISLGVMELLSLGIMTNFLPRMQQILCNGQRVYQDAEVIPMLAVAGLVACVGSVLCGVLDTKVGPKKAIIITYIIAIISIILNVAAGNVAADGNKPLATGLFYASLPFLSIMLGGAANYLVSLTNTIWGRYDFPMAYRVLKPFVAIVGALGITICGGVGNAGPGYGVAYMILGVLAVIGTIIMFTVDDTQVGRD